MDVRTFRAVLHSVRSFFPLGRISSRKLFGKKENHKIAFDFYTKNALLHSMKYLVMLNSVFSIPFNIISLVEMFEKLSFLKHLLCSPEKTSSLKKPLAQDTTLDKDVSIELDLQNSIRQLATLSVQGDDVKAKRNNVEKGQSPPNEQNSSSAGFESHNQEGEDEEASGGGKKAPKSKDEGKIKTPTSPSHSASPNSTPLPHLTKPQLKTSSEDKDRDNDQNSAQSAENTKPSPPGAILPVSPDIQPPLSLDPVKLLSFRLVLLFMLFSLALSFKDVSGIFGLVGSLFGALLGLILPVVIRHLYGKRKTGLKAAFVEIHDAVFVAMAIGMAGLGGWKSLGL